jgi:hypothetical protein
MVNLTPERRSAIRQPLGLARVPAFQRQALLYGKMVARSRSGSTVPVCSYACWRQQAARRSHARYRARKQKWTRQAMLGDRDTKDA